MGWQRLFAHGLETRLGPRRLFVVPRSVRAVAEAEAVASSLRAAIEVDGLPTLEEAQKIAGLERAVPVVVVTQNVDDLHQRAGNTDTIRLHGDILVDRWLEPCRRGRACDPAAAGSSRPPRCAECGNLARPGVVWFGEMLPSGAMEAAERAARSAKVMLVVGTSGAVWPAAGLAATARRAGAFVAIVNPQASEIDAAAHLLVPGTAAQVLPRLFG